VRVVSISFQRQDILVFSKPLILRRTPDTRYAAVNSTDKVSGNIALVTTTVCKQCSTETGAGMTHGTTSMTT
jgi:hypothetical protein